MIKYLPFGLIVALLAIVCQPALAQQEGPELRWGAKVGVNLANISDDPGLQDKATGLGTEFGIYGRIGDRFYVQPGLDFVTYKSHIIRTVQPRPGERGAFVTSYLRVPALFGYRTDYEGRVLSHLRFFAGPAFAFNVGVKDNNLGVRRKDVRNTQFSLSGGAGFDIRFLTFDVTYHHGVSTVFNADNSEGKTRAFSLTAGVAF